MHESMQKSRRIFTGRIVQLRVDQVSRPDGSTAQREVISHHGAVALLACPQPQQIVLVQQYRYAVGELLWELPAGLIELDEEPVETAHRELEEETGYQAGRLVHLMTLHTSPGFCDERIYIYHATALRRSNQRHSDDDERLRTHCFGLDEVRRMIREGGISDAKTVAGVLALASLSSPL